MAVEACSEIAEGLLLYTSVQLNHLSRNSVRQLNPQLRLWLELPARSDFTNSESPQSEFQVQILASGLGCYYLDGTSFLNTLYLHGSSFKHCLSSSIISSVQLLCRCIGEHSTVTCCRLNTTVSPPVVQENVTPRPSHFNPTTILITFQANLSKEQLTKLLAHLHLMHITNPEITCSVECADSQYSLHLAAESFKQFAGTRMITSLTHFYSNHSSLPVRQSKLHLLKGDTYTISKRVLLASGSKVTLKVYCTAAIVPHIALRNGRKIPANRLCKHIHISVFDPSHLPLIVAGSMPNFPLASLAEWDSYGMELRHSHLINDHLIVTPSYICEISNVRIRQSSTTPRSGSSVPTNHHLHLFIFLDDTTRDSGLGKNCQWKQSMELHHKLRGMFQTLVIEQSKKFQQAVHSALNKLICNYGSHAKTKAIMATAIPLISDAVASILKHSTNESFKQNCREIMQVGTGETGFGEWISERLWKAAKDKLGVTPPTENSTPNPDEPTSPELTIAADEKPNTESSVETRTAESASQSHTEELSGIRPLISNQDSLRTLPELESHDSSQSGLFQARIASNLASSQETRIANYTESSEDLDFEALSNFEDLSSQDGTASDSDETIISDFDELEGVSDGELAFSDQSSSPLLLSSTKTVLSNIAQLGRESPSTSLEVTVAMERTNTIPVEPMDATFEDKANFDNRNCYSDEDGTMCSPMIVCQDMNPPSGQISSQTHSSICTQIDGEDLAAALPNSEYEQHIPGTHEQAKELKDDGDTDNNAMSHLSDKEWTELSFESPVFIQAGNGNNTSGECCIIGTPTHAQQCVLPTVKHGETGRFTNSTQLQNNSAFDCLEDYEDTLSQCEDETICTDASVTAAYHNNTPHTTRHCSNTVLTSVCENGAVVRGVAPELVATCIKSPSTHDITDEDFCWEE